MKKVNIGLDVGIASVGWAVVNAEEFEIVDAGSRLFEEANNESKGASAAVRREYRSRRRNLRRDKLRRCELKKLFVDQGWIKNKEDFDLIQPTSKNVYQLRLEALTQPKHPNELMLILSNFLKHRGVFNLKDEAVEEFKKSNNKNIEDLEKFVDSDNLNDQNDEKLWAAEIQLNNLKINQSVKGSHNKIPHEKYLSEVKEILKTQKKYGLINETFEKEFLEIFNRKRQYYEGPGKNSTFGWEGKEDVFYQRLLGFDSYNRDEVRAPKQGLYANIFNILNDLNNLTIYDSRRDSPKITTDEKQKIVSSIFNTNGKPSHLTLPKLAKMLDVKPKDIEGYRINSQKKPEFTQFEILDQIYKWSNRANIKINWLDLQHCELIDELALIMTKGQSYDYRQKEIDICLRNYNVKEHNDLSKELAIISLSGSHSLSNRTIKELLNEMWNKPHSQQEIFSSRNLRPKYHFNIEANTKFIPLSRKEIQEMYISPVAKRSFIQALKVLRAIQKLCENKYEIQGVYIELAREKNSDEQKELIKLQQKNNEKLNDEIKKNVALTSDESSRLPKKILRKLRLLIEQDGKCSYCLAPLDWYRVKDDSKFTEVDHIIPESISFSSSGDNLVLVHAKENQDKGQKTPFEYFNSHQTHLSWSEWESIVKNQLYKEYLAKTKNIRYLRRKISNLLNQTDFHNPENVEGFVERNLNDTRTSTTYLKEYLEECRRLQNFKFPIKTINGRFTNYIKGVYFDLPTKNRDYFEHHAIDAIAIAYSDLVRYKKIAPHQWSVYRSEIQGFDFRFSRMQNHNLNKQFTNETLYSFRKNENEDFVKIQKIDIYTADPNKIKKLDQLLTKESNRVLMAKADPLSFTYLQKIWSENAIGKKYIEDDKEKIIRNPFIYYRDILKQPIHKYRNKAVTDNQIVNTPIKNLRYEDNKLGKHLNVTHKYPATKENKIVAFESFKPIRLDFYRHKYNQRIRMLMLNVTDVNQINDKKLKITSNTNYENHKRNIKISPDYELIETVYPGDTIEFERQSKKYLAIAIGGDDKKSQLEVKYIHRNKITSKEKNEIAKADKNQIYVPLLSINDISKKNFDILGIKRSKYMLEFS